MKDVQRVLRWIALSAVFMAGFGLLQYFTSNGRFLWFYELPFRTTEHHVKGSFSNRNHFAHFLALGVGPLIAWFFWQQLDHDKEKSHRARQIPMQPAKFPVVTICLAVALVITAFAALISLSRGGAVALMVTSVLAVTIYWRTKVLEARYFYRLAASGVVLLGMLSIHGYDKVATRLGHYISGSIDQMDATGSRRRIWAANIAAIQDGAVVGSGAGSHREIYPIYMPETVLTEFTHAENGYLQIVSENGLPGAVLLALGLVMVGYWCFRAVRGATSNYEILCAGAVSAGLAVSVVHSLVDFVWFIPACMSLTILLAACALRLAQLTADEQARTSCRRPLTRVRWVGLAVATSLAGVWAVSTLVGPALASVHWDRFLLASDANKQLANQQLHQPAKKDENTAASQTLLRNSMILHLEKTLQWYPNFARAHRRLAAKYLQQFDQLQQSADNAMSASQIRDAAIASKFSSSEELYKWLSQAFGENSKLLYKAYFHARRAVEIGPMQGEAYLYLANLCFLEGGTQEAIDGYINQAISVRPYDGDVLFEAGLQQVRSARVEKAYDYWAQAYRQPGKHQRLIINFLAPQIPVALFLERFQPDWNTLRPVWRQYQEIGQAEDLQLLIDYSIQAAAKEAGERSRSAMAWIFVSLARMQIDQQQLEPALENLQKAYTANPNNYTVRRALGRNLLNMGQYQAAEAHLRWCLARRPDDKWLEADLLKSAKGQDQQQNQVRTGALDAKTSRFRY